VLLTGHLARGDKAVAFIQRCLEAIEPGADVTSVPHRWAVWLWQGAPEPLCATVANSDCLAASEAAVGLHRRAAGGESIARQEWRQARAVLGRLAEGDTDAAAAASVLAAACWDFHSVPGAAADMASTREKMMMASIRREEGWGTVQMEAVQQIIVEQRNIAEAKVGPQVEGADVDESRKRLSAEILRLLGQLNSPLLRQNARINERVKASIARLRDAGQNALIELVGPSVGSLPART
jgi:hypothetical protein